MEWKAVETVTTAAVSNDSDADIVSAIFSNCAVEGALYLLSNNPDGLRNSSRPFIWKESGITYY